MAITFEKVKKTIDEKEVILIGLGREFATMFGKDGEICRVNAEKEEKIRAAYGKLKDLLEKKNYFIITENMDDVVYEQGFSDKRIVTPCGSFFRLQCRCNDESHLWPVTELWNAEQKHICEACGGIKIPNIYHLNAFNFQSEPYVYNENGYIKQWNLYNSWLMACLKKKIFLLELGVGFEMPNLIRWPFERITFMGREGCLVRVNQTFPQVDEKIREKADCVGENAVDFILGSQS